MLVYKCNGQSYSTFKKCENEVENELPGSWLSITGKIKNGLRDAHYIECNGAWHFCSRRCLENFLFKDVNPPQGQGALNTMINDPGTKQEEATQDTAPAEQQATEQESAEEGTTEG